MAYRHSQGRRVRRRARRRRRHPQRALHPPRALPRHRRPSAPTRRHPSGDPRVRVAMLVRLGHVLVRRESQHPRREVRRGDRRSRARAGRHAAHVAVGGVPSAGAGERGVRQVADHVRGRDAAGAMPPAAGSTRTGGEASAEGDAQERTGDEAEQAATKGHVEGKDAQGEGQGTAAGG